MGYNTHTPSVGRRPLGCFDILTRRHVASRAFSGNVVGLPSAQLKASALEPNMCLRKLGVKWDAWNNGKQSMFLWLLFGQMWHVASSEGCWVLLNGNRKQPTKLGVPLF